MKFLRSLRKPAWEGRDPVERARAVATGTAPELVARLPDLARLDPDAQVRRAAVKRLHDLALLADRMRLDTDAGVRDAARGRLDALLTDRTQLAPLAERIRLMRVEEDADLLVRVAEAAPEAELRRVALERIERPGLIAERCQKDPDLDVRLWLLGRIESPGMLERIAESTRRGDKHLSRAARDRLDALKLAAGDPDTVKRRALAMCETLDALRRTRPADTAAQLDGLRREWAALKPLLGADVVTRVEGYFRVFDPTPARVAEPAPETVAAPAAEAALAEPAPPQAPSEPDAKLAQLVAELDERHATIERAAFEALRRRVEQRWRALAAPTGTDRETHARFAELERKAELALAEREKQAAEHVDALGRAVHDLDNALDHGHLADSRRAHAALLALRGNAALPASVARKLASAEERLRKLATWQHWSNNKVRARLCEELEAIPGTGLHPDAVATKVREAQAEWERLDASERVGDVAPAASEPTGGARRDSGLGRRFRAACHHAIAPTRPYFEKRDEVRGQHASDIEALLARAEAPGERGRELPLRRELTAALQRLDTVPPKQRGDLGRRLRAALTTLDNARDTREKDAEAAKRKLVANLRRELARAELADALDRAKGALAEWKRIGPAPKGVEQPLWDELRAIVDPWFDKERGARDAERTERETKDGEAKAILAELEALAGGDTETLRHAETRIAALQARWRALRPERAAPAERTARGGRNDRDDRRRGRDERPRRDRDARGPRERDGAPDDRLFDNALAGVRAAQQRADQSRARGELDTIAAAARLCDRLERTTDADARAALVAELDAVRLPHDATALAARIARAKTSAVATSVAPASDASSVAAELAVRAELVAGVETPADQTALRKAYQMRRLAERMRTGITTPPAQELRAIWIEFNALSGLDDEARESFGARIRKALGP